MTTEFDKVVAERLNLAKCPEDVFGDAATADTVKATFRQMLVIIHPDKFHGTPHERTADKAMAVLTHLKDEATRKLKDGTYGDRKSSPPAPSLDLDVKVGKKLYRVKQKLREEEFCDIYACESDGEVMDFKATQGPAENDLLDNEIKILRHLYPDGQADEKFYRYLLKVKDSFLLKGKVNRRAAIFPQINTYRSFADVLRVYPKGIDFRDMVWMLKRTLIGLGFAHSKGVVHGAVVPTYVFIEPKTHGAKLTGWYYATQGKGHIKAIVSDYEDYYPPEVFDKKTPTAATDIYMAAKCAIALVGGNVKTGTMPDSVPAPIQGFLNGSAINAVNKRPQNAWDLHDEFDALLAKVVGKRAYREFKIP
jgi:serine/threonine protein kinase